MINVCKCTVTHCSVNGFDCTNILHNIKIYETVCKPYITAELTFINNKGQLNETQPLSGQSPVICIVLDSRGNTYTFSGIYTKAPDEFDKHNVGEGYVTIHAITQDYWNDKRSLVTDATQGTGTQLVKKIHDRHIQTQLNILEESVGTLSQTAGGGYNVSGESPFTAIRIIGEKLVYGASPAGATVYFRDSNKHNFGPAQALVRKMTAAADVEQKQTIGEKKENIWGNLGLKSILMSKVYKKEEAPDPVAEVAAAGGKAGVNDYEQYGRFADIGSLRTMMGGFGVGATTIGLISTAIRNEAHQAKAVHESSKTVAEWNYKAAFARAPNYLIKVVLEAGMLCTVGQGIKATLMAPLTGKFNTIEGTFLIADLMHDCYFDNREIMGTTTMRIVDPPQTAGT